MIEGTIPQRLKPLWFGRLCGTSKTRALPGSLPLARKFPEAIVVAQAVQGSSVGHTTPLLRVTRRENDWLGTTFPQRLKPVLIHPADAALKRRSTHGAEAPLYTWR